MHRFRVGRESSVTAVFEDRALSFILAKGATLGDLSDRLADLGQGHNGSPVTVTVRFCTSPREAASTPIRRSDLGDTPSEVISVAG